MAWHGTARLYNVTLLLPAFPSFLTDVHPHLAWRYFAGTSCPPSSFVGARPWYALKESSHVIYSRQGRARIE